MVKVLHYMLETINIAQEPFEFLFQHMHKSINIRTAEKKKDINCLWAEKPRDGLKVYKGPGGLSVSAWRQWFTSTQMCVHLSCAVEFHVKAQGKNGNRHSPLAFLKHSKGWYVRLQAHECSTWNPGTCRPSYTILRLHSERVLCSISDVLWRKLKC